MKIIAFLLLVSLTQSLYAKSDEDLVKGLIKDLYHLTSSENLDDNKKALDMMLPSEENLLLVYGEEIKAFFPRLKMAKKQYLSNIDKIKKEFDQKITKIEVIKINKNTDQSKRFTNLLKILPTEMKIYRVHTTYESGTEAGSSTYFTYKGKAFVIRGAESMADMITEKKQSKLKKNKEK